MSTADDEEAEGTIHKVRPGDTTTALAFKQGLFWETVWNHDRNAELKDKRKRPNVLLPGDEIFLPHKRKKVVEKPDAERHRFRRRGVPETFRMRVLDFEGEPLADEPYRLRVDAKIIEGTLDGDGSLEEQVSPGAKKIRLEVGENGALFSADLGVGRMDPIEELSGVQARLYNLGYFGGRADGKESEALDAAVHKFCEDNELDPENGVDDDFRAKLEEAHGC